MLDELRQIAIFAKAIDHGSFKGAADDLHLAPSVVSHHVSQLEEKLGVTLIYRSTRKLSLTREGARLLRSAHVMRDAITEALDELRGQSSEPSGVLRVTITAGLSQSRLPEAIAEFSARYPKIEMHLEFNDARRNLIEDGFDLAIQVGTQKSRSLNRKTLIEGKRCIVAAQSYLDKSGPIKNPNDLQDSNWVVLAGVRGYKTKLTRPGHRSLVIEPKGQIHADSSLAVYAFVRAAAGVAIVPEFLAQEDARAGVVKILFPEWHIDALDIYAEWPVNAPKDGIARMLVSELQRKLQN